jgi:hypothetical protein
MSIRLSFQCTAWQFSSVSKHGRGTHTFAACLGSWANVALASNPLEIIRGLLILYPRRVPICRNISLNQRNHNIGLSTSTKYKKQVENSRNILCQWLASETKGGNMQLRPRDKEVRRQNYTWSRAKANYLHVNKRTHTNILILNLNAPKYFGWHIAKRRNKQKGCNTLN